MSSIEKLDKLQSREYNKASSGNSNNESIEKSLDSLNSLTNWPEPMAREAFIGIAGEVMDLISPHTEADIAAVLVQLLVALGNCINRCAYVEVEADRQYLNMLCLVVGDSAKARKGTGLGYVIKILESIDKEYLKSRRVSGLSSGEGVISAVQDEVTITVNGETQVVKPGVTDKRLLIVETEFGGTLQSLKRDGNKLSAIIRDAYDTGYLSTLTKEPLRASNAHISLIGHITKSEISRHLGNVELFNGFANRILFIASRRSKLIPFGGNQQVIASGLDALLPRLKRAVDFGRTTSKLVFDEESIRLWQDLYKELSSPKPGILDTLTARAVSHIIRLSAIYAILDGTNIIRKEHLLAAVAIWDYSESTLKNIFGHSTGNKISDKIYSELRLKESGVSQTDITRLFSNNLDKSEIAQALRCLIEANLVEQIIVRNESGRDCRVWKIKKNDSTNDEFNEIKSLSS